MLAITARLLRDIRGAHRYGIVVDEPRLEWARTVSRVRAVIADIQNVKRVQDRLRDVNGALFLEGTASFVDAHRVKLADSGRELHGERFVLAVGGKARRLPIPGAELAWTPDGIVNLHHLPESS
ncbi:MAG: NAD(P)/FAD-dependent oxidoreductase [Pleurocapsa sp. SU_196_0]|nr:NAD(P)/FAD-dependent oxidoreductase [Pleurocapsa sp. SU_196_0]